ncbi:beta-lactamase-like protein [Mycena latifolia]|nr:beta-lactamase-like protein [Mycena latifolia]
MLLPSYLSLIFLAGATSASFEHFGIPASKSTVDVKVFNVGNLTLINVTGAVVSPVVPGHESITFPAYSFLVEHKATHRRVVFDLGVRKDPQNAVPNIATAFAAGAFTTEQTKDVAELLEDGGIPLASIENVIWSHAHFDHVGDMSTFPNTTGLVFGAGTNTATFPTTNTSTLQDSDFVGHNITEVDFAVAHLSFSGLKAIDYFGDGSFYLLDTPGHLPGHMTALARVTPTTFVALGGDTFHHAGEARPRPAFQKSFPCPAHLLESTKTSISTDYFWSPHSHVGAFDMPSRAQQLFAISDLPGGFTVDAVAAQVSLEKIGTFDADPDFFVIVAHDLSVVSALPYFPASLNDWKARNLKEKTVWGFADKANPAFAFGPT